MKPFMVQCECVDGEYPGQHIREGLEGVCQEPEGEAEHCDGCHKELDWSWRQANVFVGDGALYCKNCALVPCPKCKGEEVRPLKSTVMVDGRKFNLTWGSCSCCGAGASDATTSDDPTWTWAVVDAALADRDGVAYARLCYGNGGGGCLHEVLEQQGEVKEETKDALDILRGLSPGDVDAAVADASDLGLVIEP